MSQVRPVLQFAQPLHHLAGGSLLRQSRFCLHNLPSSPQHASGKQGSSAPTASRTFTGRTRKRDKRCDGRNILRLCSGRSGEIPGAEANLLAAALEEGRRKQNINPRMLDGMIEALPMLVPLMKTNFFMDIPSCDAAFVIVRDYLEKYPEVLTKDADAVVEKALLDAYANTNEP